MSLFIICLILFIKFGTNFIGILLVFRWELIVLLLLHICFFLLWERFHEVSLTGKSGWHYWGFQFNFMIPWGFIKYWQFFLWPNGGPHLPYRILLIPKHLFLDLNLCMSNGTVSTKMYDKWDDFDSDTVNFPFLDDDVPRRTSYGVNISQLIKFARASSNLRTLTAIIKPLLLNFLGRAIVILNFVRRFRNFIADTVLW